MVRWGCKGGTVRYDVPRVLTTLCSKYRGNVKTKNVTHKIERALHAPKRVSYVLLTQQNLTHNKNKRFFSTSLRQQLRTTELQEQQM